MNIAVIGNIRSTRTQRVLLLLEELKLPYELRLVDLANGEHRSPAFLANNHPFGRVPVFEQEDTKLFESRAICRYLLAKYKSPLALPHDLVDLGLFEQADSVGYSYFDPAIENLAYESIFKRIRGHGEPDPHLVQVYQSRLAECLDYYDDVLSKCEGLAGNSYSLVDLCHAPMIAFMSSRLGLSHEITSRTHVKVWWDRVTNRPSWKAMVAKTTSS